MAARRPPWEASRLHRRVAPHAWDDAGDDDRFATIEADVSGLIRELATARSELAAQESRQQSGLETHLLALIEVSDGFERIFKNIDARASELTPAMKAWAGNFKTIYRLLGRALEEQGVTAIETPTQQFDPYWHTATETIADPSVPPGTIVDEVKRGYVWHRRPLRKTEVVVVREGDRIE